jgi:integrase
MKTPSPLIGKLYAMEHMGSKVLTRKSMQVDVPYKSWDSDKGKVKSTFRDASKINAMIENKLKEYELTNPILPTGEDSQCALKYMAARINTPNLALASQKKYKTILLNFEYVVHRKMKMSHLPFQSLRDKSVVQALKEGIRINLHGGKEKFKSNKSWDNYMTVFGKFVEDWNKNSGTQFPINIRPFTTDIGKDPKKLANTLTHEEMQRLIDYKPVGYKGCKPQILTKNIFLFQYYTGGIRIQDALTLTNKEIMSDGFQIKIKKTKQTERFPFCYEQVECLKTYYPTEYTLSEQNSKVGDLPLDTDTIIDLNRIEGLGNLNDLGLIEFQSIHNQLRKMAESNKEIIPILDTFEKVEQLLKDELTQDFFSRLSRRPINFLFPKLKWADFKSAYNSRGDRQFDVAQEKAIHNAECAHISSLKRISEILQLPKMGGHTPRHTLAGHLQAEGYSVEQIQRVLVHSNMQTTMEYLKTRHQSDVVNQTVSESIEKFRAKRAQVRMRN